MPEDNRFRRLTDDEVAEIIRKETGSNAPASFQQLDREIQNTLLVSLKQRGASIKQLQRITGIGRNIIQRAKWVGEICRESENRPLTLFHLAAQPLVRLSYEIPVETYETNVMGTINVMEAIRHLKSSNLSNSSNLSPWPCSFKCTLLLHPYV